MLHRLDLFAVFGPVYFLGVIDDIISSAPFQFNIFVEMLLLYVLITNVTLFHVNAFVVTWYGFAVLSLVAMLGRWLVVSIYYSQFFAVVDDAVQLYGDNRRLSVVVCCWLLFKTI